MFSMRPLECAGCESVGNIYSVVKENLKRDSLFTLVGSRRANGISPYLVRIARMGRRPFIPTPRRQLFRMRQPRPGDSPADCPISPVNSMRGDSTGRHIWGPVESPCDLQTDEFRPSYRGEGGPTSRRPLPLQSPAIGPEIPTRVPLQNIRRPSGRRGLQAGSRIRISPIDSFFATTGAVRKWCRR